VQETETVRDTSKDFRVQGEFTSLTARKIREDTCQHFGYRVGEFGDKTAQFAYYYDPDTRKPVAAKVRLPNKEFTIIGPGKNNLPLYGQHLWNKGKAVTVVEGEIDCLTVSQLQGNKYPVVSVPNGAQGAAKAIKKALEWLSGFESVVFMFDMDDHGIKAAKECAELLPPGKAKIAYLPLKDANECLQAGRGEEVISAFWNAKPYRPDGIISGADLYQELITEETIQSVSYPWSALNAMTMGLRQSELVTITAGSGIGKSAVVREIAYHLLSLGETVGMIMLEESVKRTALGLIGLHLSKPLHLGKERVDEDTFKQAFDATLGTQRLYLYDHFGSTDIANLLGRVRYMARSLDCRWIILDHLSIVVSGLEGNDERKLIDMAMTQLRTLVQETGIGLILVSHLKRPEGNKGHEEGATTSLSQLRGSHAIAQLSDTVIGLERNQQGENPNETVLRVLKNRFSGEAGEAGTLYYDKDTGRLTEAPVRDTGVPPEF
jgi:twinkle protein